MNTEYDDLVSLRNASMPAFENLYRRYSGKLYNFILKLSGGDRYVAEELVQRTFIKVWETRERIQPDQSFISYLCTISRNMLLNEYEHQTVKFIYEEYIKLNLLQEDSSTEKQVDKNLLEQYIDRLTEQLPPRRKEIFILSRKWGLSNKEIAQQLQITESTIETQLSKALAFMKNQLRENYDFIFLLLFMLLMQGE
jgi:RNA polymerase sigma-70 factor (ECF subfamily)